MYTFKRYTSKYIGILFNTENQFCSYVNVFHHKASNLLLKEFFLSLNDQARENQRTLLAIMAQLNLKPSDISSDGIRGIFKEAFRMIEDTKSSESVDDIMIFSLIQAAYYKLSHYHHILVLLRQKNMTGFIHKIEHIIEIEENSVIELQEMQSSIHRNKFSQQAEQNLVY